MAKTSRLDMAVLERGLLPSRQAAQAAIMDGGVLVNGQKVTKPGTPVKADAKIELTSSWQGAKYVSRGGFKLERALSVFNLDPAGRTCLDVGASTGGFTDCLLKHGASLVYAIDVGYGQLDWGLRQDERVVVMERTNARHLSVAELYRADDIPRANMLVADLSFISLRKVLPHCATFLVQAPTSDIVALIKPQFEAGRENVGKGGVVRGKETHIDVLSTTIADLAKQGMQVQAITHSPIKGPAGNIEFLGHWKLAEQAVVVNINDIVEQAHRELKSAQTEVESAQDPII